MNDVRTTARGRSGRWSRDSAAPVYAVLPKPLVPVGDRPILELIFDWLARNGIESVDVCIGHLGELIQTYFSQAQTIPRPGGQLAVGVRGPGDGRSAGLRPRCHRDPAGRQRRHPHRSRAERDGRVSPLKGRGAHDRHPDRAGRDRARGDRAREGAGHRLPGETGVRYNASMGIYLYEPRVLRDLPETHAQFPDLVLALLRAGSGWPPSRPTPNGSMSALRPSIREATRRRRISITADDDGRPNRARSLRFDVVRRDIWAELCDAEGPRLP